VVGEEKLEEIEKRLALLITDRCWSDHLATVNRIRDGIHVVKFAGKDAVGEFFRETGQAFQGLRESIDREIVETFEKIEITPEGVDWEKEGLQGPSSTWTYLVSDDPFGTNAMLGLASRSGFAAFASLTLGPLIFLWGLYLHWQRRKKKAELAERDGSKQEQG